MKRKSNEQREAEMATENVEMFAELECTVLTRRTDLDSKIIIFTFGIASFFPVCSIKQT